MAESVNGAGTLLAPPSKRLRFSVVPRSTVIEIERPNPIAELDGTAPVIAELTAWPSGERCPAWVSIQVQSAYDTYRAAVREENARREAAGEIVTDPETGDQTYVGPTHIMAQIMVTLRRDLLCAVVEGLAEHEAGMLVENDGPWLAILSSLGWWTKPAAEQAAEDSDPEVTAGADTASSSPA